MIVENGINHEIHLSLRYARYLRLLAISSLALLAACGGGGSGGGKTSAPTVVAPPEPEPEPVTGLLLSGGDSGSGLSAYRERLLATPRGQRDYAEVALAPTASDSAVGDFSTTYTLEASVDEHDILKYDGRILAIAPSRSGCCFSVEPVMAADSAAADGSDGTLVSPAEVDFAPAPESVAAEVRLYRSLPESASAELLTTLSLEVEEATEGLYLNGETLQVLLSSAWWGRHGDALIAPENWQRQRVRVLSYGLGNPEQPEALHNVEIEGALVVSRRVGEYLFVVSRHTPDIEGYIAYPESDEDVATNEKVLADLTDADVLPTIRQDGENLDLLQLDNCYRVDPSHSLAVPEQGYPTITTVTTLDARSGEVLEASCVLAPASGVYVSAEQLVLTHVDYDNDSAFTYVHAFELQGFSYQGSGRIRGQLYSGGNQDFRISAYDGHLRLVTTEFTQDDEDRFDHFLFVLAVSEAAPELELVGQLPAEGGEEIGKADEDLYGVRFLGERAYLVTFLRRDPLYVIDLSDPANPTIAGRLDVPGFSDLLHPVSEDLLLGVGRDANNAVKVELFNIADPQAPRSAGVHVLADGWEWSDSPAQYNRYAFTYLAEETSDRLTVPYTAGGRRDEAYQQINRVALLTVLGTEDPESARLAHVADLALSDEAWVGADTRVLLDGNAVYVLANGGLSGTFWDNPQTPVPIK